jgi:hypothetical protein
MSIELKLIEWGVAKRRGSTRKGARTEVSQGKKSERTGVLRDTKSERVEGLRRSERSLVSGEEDTRIALEDFLK